MKAERVTIKITTSKAVKAHLEALLPLGLHGSTVSEAAERVLCEALMKDLNRTKLALLNPKPDTDR